MQKNGRATYLLSVLILSMLCIDALGKTIYIGNSSSADFDSIQEGIDEANDGDTVLVAPGEYVITEPITFRGKAITVRSEAGRDETAIRMGTPSDSKRGTVVIFENGEAAESILDGFTITGGTGSWVSSVSAYAGGGISFEASSGTVKNCAIVENKVGSSGAGILCAYTCSPRLFNCIIASNSAGVSGGGVFRWHGTSLILTNCAIMQNSAGDTGGGVFCGTNSSMTMTGCTISKNYAANHGAGVMSWDSSSVVLSNCAITKNSSGSEEGAGFCGQNSSMTMTNCTITGNSAASECGAILCWRNASVTISNSIIWGNIAPHKGEVRVRDGGTINISHSDVTGGQAAALIDSGTVNWGEGNIDADPHFVHLGYLDDKGTRDSSDDVWVDGDYHLKSQAERWDTISESWVVDDVTSPCIDTGDKDSPVAFEPFPNGGIVNMGAYGGTAQASKSPSGLHAKYGGGSGESDNPYLIYTAEQMNTIGLHAEDRDCHFKLMADIDLGDLGTRDFNMIGRFPHFFRGVFDGNGHTISNFTYISTDVDGVALFSYVEGAQAEIRDLGLIDPIIDAGVVNPVIEEDRVEGNRAGSLIDYLRSGAVRRCYVQGGSISADLNTGGLVAYNQKGIIAECSSTVNVSGFVGIGGLVGYNRGAIVNCRAESAVTGRNAVGGLLGWNDGTVQDSSAIGEVLGDTNVGGLVGKNRSVEMIQSSFSTGSVSGVYSVGGLVGNNDTEIANCYSTCSVSGGYNVGGLVGLHRGVITSCYSAGHVVFEPIYSYGDYIAHIGGLLGYASDANDVLQSFWDIETSVQTVSAGGTGLTTAEMHTPSTFLEAGWDLVYEADNGIDDIWWIVEGRDYPRLWWELTGEN